MVPTAISFTSSPCGPCRGMNPGPGAPRKRALLREIPRPSGMQVEQTWASPQVPSEPGSRLDRPSTLPSRHLVRRRGSRWPSWQQPKSSESWSGLQPSSRALTFLRIPGVCSVSSALAALPSHLRPTPKELTLLSTWRALSKKHPGPSQAEASTWVLQHTCSSCFRSRFCPGPRCPEFSANVGSLRSPGNLKTITRWLLPAPPHS